MHTKHSSILNIYKGGLLFSSSKTVRLQKNQMHLEKLLIIGSTESGLASFRSGWLESNNFGPLQEAAYPQNSIEYGHCPTCMIIHGYGPSWSNQPPVLGLFEWLKTLWT